MSEIVIVGGGLCGLFLAKSLLNHGLDFSLYEARDRLGGRVLTEYCRINNLAVDLGATWFWPETQPRITQMVSELGLESFAQHDAGDVLRLTNVEEQAAVTGLTEIHGGARRIVGGMGKLVGAISKHIPSERLHLNHALLSIEKRDDDSIILRFCAQGTIVTTVAQKVILAIPPRLLEEHVHFDPPLDDSLTKTLRATPTWMASQAKAVVAYQQAFWREAGRSGNAFVSHQQVVLPEIFDACDRTGEQAALGAFFSLPPDFRASIPTATMSLLVSSQLVQVFGLLAEDGEQHLFDWATERYTCSSLDHTLSNIHPDYSNPILRQPLWHNRLFLGGSETAGYDGGYLEGALEAAARIERLLLAASTENTATALCDAGDNDECIDKFSKWVTAQKSQLLDNYRRHLNRGLSRQYKDQLTQQALLSTLEQFYSDALHQLSQLPFDTRGIEVRNGRSDLTPKVQALFADLQQTLLSEALTFNRGSCELSSFPWESEPDQEYLSTIARDLAAAWREFILTSNAILLAKDSSMAKQ